MYAARLYRLAAVWTLDQIQVIQPLHLEADGESGTAQTGKKQKE
jgi:hypothetical protein